MCIIVARLDEDLSNKSSVLSVLDLMPEAVRNATSVCPLQKAKCCDETFFCFLVLFCCHMPFAAFQSLCASL